MYSNFEFYKTVYCGKRIKAEEDFTRLGLKSSAYIEIMTMGRIKTSGLSPELLEKVKLCECELCDSFLTTERSTGLRSENNDGYSVTFSDASGTSCTESRNRNIITKYLWDTGFLYKGMRT